MAGRSDSGVGLASDPGGTPPEGDGTPEDTSPLRSVDLPPTPDAAARADAGVERPDTPRPPVPRPAWEAAYATGVLLLDAIAVTVAAFVAHVVRFGVDDPSQLRGVPYLVVTMLVPATWVVALWLARAYEPRFLGVGTEEYQRVARGVIGLLAVVASGCYAADVELARGYVAVAIPLGLALTLLARRLARLWLYRRRQSGRWSHRAVAVGDPTHLVPLIEEVRSSRDAGFAVIGVCVPGGRVTPAQAEALGVPVLGGLVDVEETVRLCQADTVAVAAGPGLDGRTVRRLSWQLEGTGVDLLLAPSLTDVAGPRISIRPVARLPLLHVEEPEFRGSRRVVKSVMDRSLAGLGLLVLLPLLVLLGVAVRLTSRGPATFTQERVGRAGEGFRLWKLRTMYVDAEERRAELEHLNEASDGLLFKLRDDPRVTPVGRWLRRLSLDELPQLWNVVRGDMALVGPRPPLASEVDRYDPDVRRRLLVKPGITGLWQVSGRSDLSWEQSVRLDLYYVENWSIALDLVILWKTFAAVVRSRGAY